MCVILCHVVKCVGVEKILELFIPSYSKVGGVASCGETSISQFLHFYFVFTKTCISFVRNKESIFLYFARHSVLMTTRLNLPFRSNLSQFQASCLNYIIYNCALDSFFPLPFCILSPLWGKPFPSLPIFRFYYVYSSNSSASITHFYVYISQLIVFLYSHFKFCILLSYHIL